MTAPELKPCPFCGGAAELSCGYAECGFCLCAMPSSIGYDGEKVGFDTETEAITAWNTRADMHDATKAQLAKAVEALREIERNYANPDMTHLDYRVGAMQSAFAVLAEIEKGTS
jgi:hypothetical protein